MKRVPRWVCPILFLSLCAITLWFLHLFTVVDDTMLYVDWQSSVQISDDGSEQPFTIDEYSNTSDLKGSYRFAGQLPEGITSGYLLFETSGVSLSLSLNGTEIYQSSASLPENAPSMSQATVPLPEGATGELVMTCEISDGTRAMFPPLVRYMPDGLKDTETFAIANRTGFPTGASALVFLLVAGLFLAGIMLGKPDWSLIPLILASLGMIVYRISQGEGYYFLPQWATDLLSRPEIGLFTALALVVYLAVNRRRHFWKYLGIAAAWSAAALLIFYFASSATGGSLSDYINSSISALIQTGFYDGLLYWITFWLTAVSTLISTYMALCAFADQQMQTQNLALKNKMMMKSFHTIEAKMKETAFFRHELNHQLTALDCLCQKKDYSGIKELLDQWKKTMEKQPQAAFTKNLIVNTILQEASQKAAQYDVSFNTLVSVPKDLNIPEQDLCSLLMNMLDNALEGCQRVEPADKRFIRFRAREVQGTLAIRCENSFTGNIKKDKKGCLLTTKEDAVSHGFGLSQMSKIAEKYHSQLDVSYNADGIFTLQTALKIPELQEASH